jgi:hypothetical protein
VNTGNFEVLFDPIETVSGNEDTNELLPIIELMVVEGTVTNELAVAKTEVFVKTTPDDEKVGGTTSLMLAVIVEGLEVS